MPRLKTSKRSRLPDRAFAYIDSRGRRRLPVHDKAHVRNALARFNQVAFEDDAARERARTRLLNAAKKYGIVPVGFITGQLQSERRHATAGRLVIELGRNAAPGELEQRLRTVLRDPTLAVLHWSDASGAYLDATGKVVPLPAEGDQRGATYLERQGRPMTVLVHDPTILDDPALAETVLDAVRFVVEKERLHGQIPATSTDAAALPTGFVTLLMTDIEGSTVLLRRLGDRYGALLNDVRGILRAAVSRADGREIDARADEFFAVFERATAAAEAAVAIQRELGTRAWPDDLADSRGEPRVRVGIHSGRPTRQSSGPRPYRGPQRPPDTDRSRVHRSGRSHHRPRLLGSSRRADRRLRGCPSGGRGGALDRHPIPQPRSTSPSWPVGRGDALPGSGAGPARQVPSAANHAPLGPSPAAR